VLKVNSVVHGGIGIAALVVPTQFGWALYENEGCKYFQHHTRVLGCTSIALAILNYQHSLGQAPRALKATLTQVMLGVNVGVIVLSIANLSLFTPLASAITIASNVVLAGANGFYGFLSERGEQ